jgi:hypothetical protein
MEIVREADKLSKHYISENQRDQIYTTVRRKFF